MGQTLSEPVTSKETASCFNSYLKVGSSCMQGWRINMEDAHTHLLSIPEDKEASFFGVYDGHGGAKVAHYAGNHLHKKIINTAPYAIGDIVKAMKDGFLSIDKDMIKDEEMKDELAGTTAVTVLIKNGKIYCGNVGDSRSVISVNGIAHPLSYDHKPANEEESRRITAAGGWVEFNRVNGNLALSRALGDFIFKRNDDKTAEEQIVTALPDVTVREMTADSEFIILACDGIWDVLSNQEVVDFCRDRIAAKMEPEQICEELLTRCLAPDCQMGGLGCDNMTVVLVCLLQNEGWDELCKKCNRPRPPTPSADEDSDGSQSGFETPPVTPIHRNYSGKKPSDSALAPGLTSCTAPLLIPERFTNQVDQLINSASTVGEPTGAKIELQPESSTLASSIPIDLATGSPVATPPKVSRLADGLSEEQNKPLEDNSEDELPPSHFEVATGGGGDELEHLVDVNKATKLESLKVEDKQIS